jgi:UDP-N-acetylglucosamine:LPS N-acetylglucosamine transferase
VGEAWATRTPCVFMPYPFHKDEHQRANAIPLVEAGAGVLVRDAIEPAANLESAGPGLLALLRDGAARERLRAGLARLGPANGAERVAREIGGMIAGHGV